MKRKIASALITILILTSGLVCFHKVFLFKSIDGMQAVKSFYELENDSVDVLVLGNSHAYMNINPMIIWEDTGIAVYDLGGPSSPVWNCYHYLKEALKTQKPKLVILEGFTFLRDSEYHVNDQMNMENFYGMKPSVNKWETLKVSFPREDWAGYGLEYIQYHNRHNDLSAADFRKYNDNTPLYSSWKGMINMFQCNEEARPDVTNDGTRAELNEKVRNYYEKIIDLCKEEGIELMVVVAPYGRYKSEHLAYYNSARDIADEADVPFVDYNEYYDDIGLDWQVDFVDGDHMSWFGNAKFSHYLAGQLAADYTWEDHSNEAGRYGSWDRACDYYERSIADYKLSLITDPGEYSDALCSLPQDYTIIINIKDNIGGSGGMEKLAQTLAEWGVPVNDVTKEAGMASWVVDDGIVTLASENGRGYNWSKRYGKKELLADRDGIYWDRVNYQRTDEGVNIVVFDERNEMIADAVGVTDIITRK